VVSGLNLLGGGSSITVWEFWSMFNGTGCGYYGDVPETTLGSLGIECQGMRNGMNLCRDDVLVPYGRKTDDVET
jgi:hypothetical protein